MIRVFLAGEGPNELGAFGKEESFQPSNDKERRQSPGVLEALLRHVQEDGWEVTGGIRWKDIRKLQVGGGKKGTKPAFIELSSTPRSAVATCSPSHATETSRNMSIA